MLDPTRKDDCEEFLKQVQFMNQALSLCKSMVSEEDQHEAAYFSVLRIQVLKITGKQIGGKGGMSLDELNKRVASLIEQSIKTEGVINLIEKQDVTVSLFDENFLKEIANMKENNIAYETLRRLIEEQVKEYKKKSVVKSEKFSEKLQKLINSYLNGMLTNAEIIEELLGMAQEIMDDRKDELELGLTEEETAFYDALTKPDAVKDFYTNEQLKQMTQELTETMRKSATID